MKKNNADLLTQLPFVRDTTPAERTAGAPPRLFWNVQPTGNHFEDCATGEYYAALTLDYIFSERFTPLLGWIILGMIENGPTHSDIEIGFCGAIGRNLLSQQHRILTRGRMCTHESAGEIDRKEQKP